MQETKGNCKHGEFDLKTGCPECIAENRAEAEVNSPENIKKRIDAVQVRPEQEEMEQGLNAEGFTLRNPSPDPNAWRTGEEEVRIVGPEPTAVVKIDPGTAPSFAKHLASAKRVLEIAASREILTEADAKSVNDDLNVMAELEKAVEAERKTFTVPLNGYLSSINGEYKLITDPLTEAKQIYRKLLIAYKVEQKRQADEAEKLNRDAMEVARRQAEANHGEITVETKPVPVPFAPKLTRTDQGKSGLVDKWGWEVNNFSLLPDEYKMPDEVLLTAVAKKYHDKKQVDGVRFFNSPSLRVSR